MKKFGQKQFLFEDGDEDEPIMLFQDPSFISPASRQDSCIAD